MPDRGASSCWAAGPWLSSRPGPSSGRGIAPRPRGRASSGRRKHPIGRRRAEKRPLSQQLTGRLLGRPSAEELPPSRSPKPGFSSPPGPGAGSRSSCRGLEPGVSRCVSERSPGHRGGPFPGSISPFPGKGESTSRGREKLRLATEKAPLGLWLPARRAIRQLRGIFATSLHPSRETLAAGEGRGGGGLCNSDRVCRCHLCAFQTDWGIA